MNRMSGRQTKSEVLLLEQEAVCHLKEASRWPDRIRYLFGVAAEEGVRSKLRVSSVPLLFFLDILLQGISEGITRMEP